MARLQITDIEALRANSAPLPLTVAPVTSSDNFKSHYTQSHQLAKRWESHFSAESQHFQGSEFKQTSSPAGKRRIITLGTGRPTAEYYPWESLSFKAHDVLTEISNGTGNPYITTECTIPKYGDAYNLSVGLNYGRSAGSPHLLRFLTEHIELVHNPPYRDWGVFLSCGATAAFEAALRIFCNRGDTILTERHTYPGSLEAAVLNGLQVYAADMDADGLIPEALEGLLICWDKSLGPKPRVLYTIPTGQNPTGFSQPTERRKAIYNIAEKHDLIIIEDDPYYFLRLGDYTPGKESEMSAKVFADESVPSYLSLDTSGRVVRLDSASKILSPGLRAGWVTASSQVIDKFLAYQDVTTVAVNGPSQLMLWSLLDCTWGHDGFAKWLVHLSAGYQRRRDIMLRACDCYLPHEIAHWVPPRYGMFLWISVDWTKHPTFENNLSSTPRTAGVNPDGLDHELQTLEARVLAESLEAGVLVAKGSLFSAARNVGAQRELNFRMTFAAAEEDDLEEGVRLFGEVLKKEFGLTGISAV
ncbi:aminotransferase-like domain-containing protein [Aspergillus mulundensis]|uniref:Aminotransferase class I/classII large domain-containing protein n=1 Tax=Aspergillus mulundensis TaxID=1810919 RepID=A0A3D8T2I1_9EURO|nr:hypothetical protein DSM5745_00041 [Aspergillus mulundensis]RDW92719.1 hypothetical protein DSM5745_00041 [Aspergillus mulundensis]